MAKAKEEKMPATEEPGSFGNRATDYVMPDVEVGDLVQFRNIASDEPSPAVVISVSGRCVDLSVTKNNGAVMLKDAVRHQSDPDLINKYVSDRGMWCHTKRTMQLLDLLGKGPAADEGGNELKDLLS